MFIEMEVKTVVIGGGPVSSLIVLQPTQQNEDEPLNLPIRIEIGRASCRERV